MVDYNTISRQIKQLAKKVNPRKLKANTDYYAIVFNMAGLHDSVYKLIYKNDGLNERWYDRSGDIGLGIHEEKDIVRLECVYLFFEDKKEAERILAVLKMYRLAVSSRL